MTTIRTTDSATRLVTLEYRMLHSKQIFVCKPCPFCGSDHLTVTDWWDDDGEYPAIACLGCKAEAPATQWNNRHER